MQRAMSQAALGAALRQVVRIMSLKTLRSAPALLGPANIANIQTISETSPIYLWPIFYSPLNYLNGTR
jgi:hypothetical protein